MRLSQFGVALGCFVVIWAISTIALPQDNESRFDGRWVGSAIPEKCLGPGPMEFSVVKGKISGHFDAGQAAWIAPGRYTITGRISDTGKLDKVTFYGGGGTGVIQGELTETTGNGTLKPGFYSCGIGTWKASRVERPQATAAKTDPTSSAKQQPQPSGKSDGSVESRLRLLNQLLERGLISSEQAAEKRRKLLKEM